MVVKFPSDLAKYGAIYGISFFCFLLLFMKVKQTVMCERFVKTEKQSFYVSLNIHNCKPKNLFIMSHCERVFLFLSFF